MSIFQKGSFKSHSGIALPWKIECDELTTEDMEVVRDEIVDRFIFSEVHGVPTGGEYLADMLKPHCVDRGYGNILIVDDVMTTGKSMREMKEKLTPSLLEDPLFNNSRIYGIVIFSRAVKPPNWVFPFFQMHNYFAERRG